MNSAGIRPQGKIVICTMVAVGIGMAGFAWWARFSASRRILDNFGAQVTVAVRSGEPVELWRLSPVVSAGNLQPVESKQGETLAYVDQRLDITDTPGLIHARHHLLHERGFDWGRRERAEDPTVTEPVDARATEIEHAPGWGYALHFRHERGNATWLLDFARQRAKIIEADVEVGVSPIAPSLEKFVLELLPRQDPVEPSP